VSIRTRILATFLASVVLVVGLGVYASSRLDSAREQAERLEVDGLEPLLKVADLRQLGDQTTQQGTLLLYGPPENAAETLEKLIDAFGQFQVALDDMRASDLDAESQATSTR
jgi:hypothetical protein